MEVGCQRHAPATLTPVKRPVTYCSEDWMGPRTGAKDLSAHWDSTPEPSSTQRVAIVTELFQSTCCAVCVCVCVCVCVYIYIYMYI